MRPKPERLFRPAIHSNLGLCLGVTALLFFAYGVFGFILPATVLRSGEGWIYALKIGFVLAGSGISLLILAEFVDRRKLERFSRKSIRAS